MGQRNFWGVGGGGRDSRRHSTTSFSKNVMVAETSLQMLQVLAFAIGKGLNLFPNKYNSANFSGEKGTVKLVGMSVF